MILLCGLACSVSRAHTTTAVRARFPCRLNVEFLKRRTFTDQRGWYPQTWASAPSAPLHQSWHATGNETHAPHVTSIVPLKYIPQIMLEGRGKSFARRHRRSG